MANKKIAVYIIGSLGYFADSGSKLEGFDKLYPGGHYLQLRADCDEDAVRAALEKQGESLARLEYVAS